MRRLTTALTTAALAASLAFAPLPGTDDTGTAEDTGPTLALSATAIDSRVSGTLDYAGAMTTGSDDAGDAQVPMVGLDVGDLRMEQVGTDLVVELDLLDTAQGEVAPTALYKVDVTGTLSLMAFRGPGAWDYQVADFSDGYTSSPAQGAFDGSTITWTVPSTTFGSAGSQLAPGYLSTQGVSPAGLASLQLSAFVPIDTAKPLALFNLGGRVDVTVTDVDGQEVDTAVAFAPGGTWSYDAADLAPGTYTVTAKTAYADLLDEATVEVTVS